MEFENSTYFVDLDKLKARLFDEIMESYLDDEDGCPNYEYQVSMAVATINGIQRYCKRAE